MKTATITWISYNNYGTILQAYALQQQLLNMGLENQIIYDRNIIEEFKKNGHMEKDKDEIINHNNMINRILGLFFHPRRIKKVFQIRFNHIQFEKPYVNSQALFEMFKKNDLKVYYDLDVNSLNELNDKFDVFIAGSDQIWSIKKWMFNPYYYLDFATKKKIAYAPSLGTKIITDEIIPVIKKLLNDYYAISVRESETSYHLSTLTGKDVKWVVDPTLLHDKLFWENFIKDVPHRKKRYLLCYFLENRKWYFLYAKYISKKLNLDILLIPNKWDFLSSEYVINEGVGPREFVSLVRYADYVLTDSYHGSIFSLLFERDFLYLKRFNDNEPDSQNIRIQSLFGFLNLNERIVDYQKKEYPDLKINNYNQITKKIDIIREDSKKFLKKCFE